MRRCGLILFETDAVADTVWKWAVLCTLGCGAGACVCVCVTSLVDASCRRGQMPTMGGK